VSIRKPARRKALLAIAFAGGMLNSQLPALSESIESTDSVIHQFENSTAMPPEIRAFYLLSLARGYLAGGDQATVEAQYTPVLNQSTRNWPFRRGWETVLVPWAEQASLEGRLQSAKAEATSDSQPITKGGLVLADTAVQKALRQLDRGSDKFAKLNMYFIASQLFQRARDTTGMHKCNKVLEEAIEACEGDSPIDEQQIKAAASILNTKAYGFIPVHIPDQNPKDLFFRQRQRQTEVKSFTERDFQESEKLKLRAVAIVDRLATTNDLRRKSHRDLALWYAELGKKELAEKEKQVLFELVGCNDDSILYPQQAGCGDLVWWQKEHTIPGLLCGMG
jgi:hypothetical protein